MPGLVRPARRAILEAIDGIETAVRGKTLDDFACDWLLRHGVQRGIEIISEAARRIPPELQATQAQIPWAPQYTWTTPRMQPDSSARSAETPRRVASPCCELAQSSGPPAHRQVRDLAAGHAPPGAP
jgi:hypothetical protein